MAHTTNQNEADDEQRPLITHTSTSNSLSHNLTHTQTQNSTFSTFSTSSSSATHGHHRPHHMKYGGNVTTSGFTPQLDDDDEADIEHFRAVCGNFDIDNFRVKMRRDKTREILDAEARRIHGNRRYLIRKPRPLQYFRGRVLVRDDEERTSSRLELFFDLTFVGLIAVLAKEVAEEPDGRALLRYVITYTGGFSIWTWMRELFNSFYKDDMLQRVLVMFVMACLVVYGNNAPHAEQNLDEGPGRAAAVTSYLLAEAAIFGNFLFYSFHAKPFRLQLRVHTAAWVIAACIWIATIFVDRGTAVALSIMALLAEYFTWGFVYSPTFKILAKLRYGSALNIEHEVERFNDFFTLVMGEFLFSVFSGSPAGLGFNASGGRAVMAVMIAFAFQLFYIMGSSARTITHPLRRSGNHAIAFFTIHLPLVCALTLCGDIMAEFVKEEHVESALSWFVCETYAIGMISLWILSNIERDCDEPGVLWIPTQGRLLPRLLSGFIAIFLPLARPHAGSSHPMLTTTEMLGILTALSTVTLIWEQIAALDGPNAEYDSAPDHLMACAKQHIPSTAWLQTPNWKGYPTCVEPGTGSIDRSHQTYRRTNTELSPEVSTA